MAAWWFCQKIGSKTETETEKWAVVGIMGPRAARMPTHLPPCLHQGLCHVSIMPPVVLVLQQGKQVTGVGG